MMMRTFGHTVFVLATLVLTAAQADAESRRFRVEVQHPGVYEVTWDQLAEAGLDGRPRASDRIALTTRGTPVAVWVEDRGDGIFGPGDRVLFVGDRPHGEHTAIDEYSAVNVYWLELDADGGWAGRTIDGPLPDAGEPDAARLVREHVERDMIMGRFNVPAGSEDDERWYWARLSVMDRTPFEQVLDLSDIDPSAPGARLVLRIGLRGWSQPRLNARDAMSDHLVEVRVDGRTVATGSWDGVDRHVIEATIPVAEISPGEHRLTLEVPKRTIERTGNMLPDIVLLNWIELEYPAAADVRRPQVRLALEGGGAADLRTGDGAPLDVFTADGVRYVAVDGDLRVPVGGSSEVVAVRPGGEFAPYRVRADRPSDLRSSGHRADYIMITHESLLAETRRLAAFHRERGLAVEVVDIQDVYDEFNSGLTHPRAIRDFLAWARANWSPPAPRFVLLAGDASWDLKNPTADDSHYADWTYRPWETTSFAKNESEQYEDGAQANNRGLIPSYNYPTYEGHAASDTWFACLEGDDQLPDIAIGRLPAATPDEMRAMVDKTIAYVRDTGVGPWRRNMLFIANENPGFQRRMDDTAEDAMRRGYVPLKIYPSPDEPVNEHHTERIVELMDEGLQIVQFLGHGGRYIWRTAPSDLKENRDLFTLDHLDRLADTPLLPVVVSLTCYSAPFDHPTADSIGEKLVRIPHRGAIAVIGASWRNSPGPQMGTVFLDELVAPGSTIGEAVMRAKHRIVSPMLVHLYNLLGDPAVPMAVPAAGLELEPSVTDDGRTVVDGRLDSDRFDGNVLVEWLDADGRAIRSEKVEPAGPSFRVVMPEDAGPIRSIRAYAWDPAARVDALGWSTALPEPARDRENDAVAADRRNGAATAPARAEATTSSTKEAS